MCAKLARTHDAPFDVAHSVARLRPRPIFPSLPDAAVSGEIDEMKDPEESKPKPERKPLSGSAIWTLKITVATLALSLAICFLTEMTSDRKSLAASFVALFALVAISIFFDTISVAATACDLAPLLAMASKRIKKARVAVALVQNAEKVANICGDVIGDMCGIISGSCSAAVVLALATSDARSDMLISIFATSAICALTVGGKAFFKKIAIKNSKQIMLFVGGVLSVFSRKK